MAKVEIDRTEKDMIDVYRRIQQAHPNVKVIIVGYDDNDTLTVPTADVSRLHVHYVGGASEVFSKHISSVEISIRESETVESVSQ